VVLGLVSFAFVLVLALARIAARADERSGRLLAKRSREPARGLESLANITIEARRGEAAEIAIRLRPARRFAADRVPAHSSTTGSASARYAR
jgi:hypothetical protein